VLAVEAEANMKIDLLSAGDAIAATRVEQVTGPTHERKLAHVLSEQKRTFAELPLDYQGRLIGVPVHRISGMKKWVTIPVIAEPWPISTDYGNCK
jgi:hypothetical protein